MLTALVDLMAGSERAEQLKSESVGWASWDLTPRQVCDLELLMNGGFSPLRGFMSSHDYPSVALQSPPKAGHAQIACLKCHSQLRESL